MGNRNKITIEAKSEDEAWYPCSLKFKGNEVLVHFLDYDSDEDEIWDINSLKTRTDVLNRVRVTSEQLQDQECVNLSVGMRVCALKELDDERKYFDATVRHIKKQKHVKTEDGEEECKCKFTVQWEGGPAKGEAGDLECCAITMLCDRDPEGHPQLKRLLRKVTGIAQSSKASGNGKRKTDGRKAPNSASKKGKSRSNASDEAKDQPGPHPLTDKKTWTSATVDMTDKEIFATINEVCDACQPNCSDTDSEHTRRETRKDGGRHQSVWTATLQEDAHEKPLQNDQVTMAAKSPTIPSRSIDMQEAGGGEMLANVSSSQHKVSENTPNSGVARARQCHADRPGSQGEGPEGQGEGSGVDGRATYTSGGLSEHGAVPAEEVVLISEDDGESYTQRSPRQSARKLKATGDFCQGYLARASDGGANTSAEMKQALRDKKSICSGFWPVNCILRIDNVEKDLCPQVARTFLSAMLQDVISVVLLPVGENEICCFGYVIFKDPQAADNAFRLVTSKCIVASQQQR